MFKIANCTNFVPLRKTREEVDKYRLQLFNGDDETLTVVSDSKYGQRYKLKQPCRIYANDDHTIVDANEFWICNQNTKDEYIVLINSITETIVSQCILNDTYNKIIRVIANEEGETNFYKINLINMEPVSPDKDDMKESPIANYEKYDYPITKIEYDEETNETLVKAKLGHRSHDYVEIEKFSSGINKFASINKAIAFIDHSCFKMLEMASYDSIIVQDSDTNNIITVAAVNDQYLEVRMENDDKIYRLPYSQLMQGLESGSFYIIPRNSNDIVVTDTIVIGGAIDGEYQEKLMDGVKELIEDGLDEVISETITIDENNIDVDLLLGKARKMRDLSIKIKLLLSSSVNSVNLDKYENIHCICRGEDENKDTYIIDLNTDLTDNLDDISNTLETIVANYNNNNNKKAEN